MKSVLHVIVGLEIGGAEMMLARLIKDAASYSSDYRHMVVSLTELGPLGTELRAQGVIVHALHMNSYWSTPVALIRLWMLMRSVKPDVVQTWMYHADLLGGAAARLAGIRRLIWGVRTTDMSDKGSRVTAGVRWVCARLSGHVPAVIVCAAEAARHRHVSLGYSANRTVVIHNGFALQLLQTSPTSVNALRASWNLESDHMVMGCIGRFNPDKGPGNFVQAAGHLALQFPRLRFLMIGRGCDSSNQELTNWIKALKLTNRFILAGERNDIPTCLALMDVFCLPSRTEAFPNVVGEAMAMGRPCVVTDVGDAAFLVGEHGIVVPCEHPKALAEGVAQLLQMPADQRAVLGAGGRKRIESEFSITRCRERLESIYSDLIRTLQR